MNGRAVADAVDELVGVLGIREDVPEQVVLDPVAGGDVKGCVEAIAAYLALPVAISISFDERHSLTPASGLEGASGSTRESAVAQVAVPEDLPMYGTPALEGFPVAVRVIGDHTAQPESFVTVVAHELSHVLLRSLRHNNWKDEIYTDLAAMVMGFSVIMLVGRKVSAVRERGSQREMVTTTYGYLSDEEFEAALTAVSSILLHRRAEKDRVADSLIACLDDCRRQLSRFTKYLERIDNSRAGRVRGEDASRIVALHQPGYHDEVAGTIRKGETRLQEIRNYCDHLSHYTQASSRRLEQYAVILETVAEDLREQSKRLRHEVALLSKYTGLLHKLRIERQVKSEQRNIAAG